MHSIQSVSKPHWGFQVATAIAAVILTAGAVVGGTVHPVYAVTGLALPIIAGVGAHIAWIALTVITVQRCRKAQPQQIAPAVHPDQPSRTPIVNRDIPLGQQLIDFFMEEKERFYGALPPNIDKDIREPLVGQMMAEYESIEILACGLEDQELLTTICDSVRGHVNSLINTVMEVTANPESADSRVTLGHAACTTAIRRMILACRRNPDEFDEAEFTRFLDTLGAEVDRPIFTVGKDTLLMFIAKVGHPIEAIKLLAEKGVDFNQYSRILKNTPLIWAIANAENQMASEIINVGREYNLNVNLPDRGRSHNAALHLAVAKGYTDQDGHGRPLVVPNFELVNALVGAGANVNLSNRKGWTPIKLAILRRDAQMVAFLLSNGAMAPTAEEREALLTMNHKQAHKILRDLVAVFRDIDGDPAAIRQLFDNQA